MVVRGRRRWWLGCLAVVVLAGCRAQRTPPPPPPAPAPEDTPVTFPAPADSAFVPPRTYRPPVVAPSIPDYQPKAGLGDIANLKDFPELTAELKAHLGRDAFVAMPTADTQLDVVYRDAAEAKRPLFVTADSALYAFQRWVDDAEQRLTAESWPGLLNALTLSLLEASQAQMTLVAGAEAKEAARRNVAYFGVAAGLLGISVDIESGAARLVAAERQRIEAHEGPLEGLVIPCTIDYRRFAPRAGDERLTRYQQALAWYASAPLAVDSAGEQGETVVSWTVARQLLLLTHALATPPAGALAQWQALFDSRSFLCGRPEGLTPHQVLAAATEVYGPQRRLRDYDDFPKLQAFVAKLRPRAPEPVVTPSRQPGSPGRMSAFVLGPVVSADDRILAALAQPVRREHASGLEVLGALGQPRADTLVLSEYRLAASNPRYGPAYQRLREELDQLDPSVWVTTLPMARLWACAPLSQPAGRGRPAFQRSGAWPDKVLQTTLATWVAGRHEPVAELPAPPDARPEPARPSPPPVAYVEPTPDTYARLRFLADLLATGLAKHGLLTEPVRLGHDALADLLTCLERCAASELANHSLTTADRQRLAGYGHELRWLLSGLDSRPEPVADRLPRVSQLAAAGNVLVYAGLGPVERVYAVVPDAGKFYLAVGAVPAYLELRRPAEPALDDAGWQALLAGGVPPGLPEWTASFVVANPLAPTLPKPVAGPAFGEAAP